uniref:SLC26A/SulP transporter domain-containing protein n=1 Tax=Chromera velia CCMP2878 TaxID=1169474 RepID=A0A0G4I9S2_9ALVE|eukprot:Cvel_12352.t1-p1 / transcript=Cvel_12352.t1 / gene=Cvel_12352 / organism=Chromera_velia_CCMP2878 / gene_product=Putative sulfate transporter YbaR, putative / transcript_product=Putative sulfate transporter YbaR, putative / location=Cvel_scaffold803:63166-65849(+) / protein_length=363 / sequence_SO=supercontig / SO=protein_coding / is_pseudo=false
MTSARTTDIPVSAGNLNDGVLQPCKNKFRETRGLLHVVSGVSRGWWPISKNKSKEHQEPPSVPSSPSTPSSFEFVKTEILVGLIVCFAKIPATVAYSFIANIPPDVSLHSSWIIGLFGSIFGGSPGVISGLSGATAAVTGTFVSRECDSCPSEGIEIYFLSILASSLFMAVFTYFRLSSLIQLVPTPVMMGFCNGLAIVIGRGQLKAFQTQEGEWMEGTEALVNSLQCVAAGLIVVLLPKVPKIGKFVPPSAIAIFVAVMLEFLVFRQVFGLSTATVGDAAGFSAETALPTPIFYSRGRWDFSKVSFSGDVVQRILVQGFSLFLVGTVEVLMTVEVVKNMLDTKEPCADQQVGRKFGAGDGRS